MDLASKDLHKCDNIELSEMFNVHIKEIMLMIESYNPDDFDIEHASTLIRHLINFNPLDLLRKAHQTLWNYRKQIKETNEEFFLKEDLISKFNVHEQNKKHQDVDIEYIINTIKNTWSLFSEDEKQNIIKWVKSLLVIAAAYRHNNKILN